MNGVLHVWTGLVFTLEVGVLYHLQSSDPAADYDEAYHRSGYDSAHSSAHGSLTSLGMC